MNLYVEYNAEVEDNGGVGASVDLEIKGGETEEGKLPEYGLDLLPLSGQELIPDAPPTHPHPSGDLKVQNMPCLRNSVEYGAEVEEDGGAGASADPRIKGGEAEGKLLEDGLDLLPLGGRELLLDAPSPPTRTHQKTTHLTLGEDNRRGPSACS